MTNDEWIKGLESALAHAMAPLPADLAMVATSSRAFSSVLDTSVVDAMSMGDRAAYAKYLAGWLGSAAEPIAEGETT